MKVKEFIKKYHLIAYLIMIILIFTVGMAVKWYRYNEFADMDRLLDMRISISILYLGIFWWLQPYFFIFLL